MADAPDLGSGGNTVQVQVLLPVFNIFCFDKDKTKCDNMSLYPNNSKKTQYKAKK